MELMLLNELWPLKNKNGVNVSNDFIEIVSDAIKVGHKSTNLLHTHL